MATLKALQHKIAKLQAQAEAIAKKESSVALEKIRFLMEKHGLTTDDIAVDFRKATAARNSTAAKTPATPRAAAKYLNPRTGATWTGRGRAPAWIANAEDRSKFLVQAADTSAVSKSTSKSDTYVRGPQRLFYRDPQSGSIWTGHGRAPTWLVNAADPIKLLVEQREAFLPEKAEATPTMEGANKPDAKADGAAAKGNFDGRGAGDRQTDSEEVRGQNGNCCETESTPVTKNTAVKLVNALRAPAENIGAEKASVLDESARAVEHGIVSDLAFA